VWGRDSSWLEGELLRQHSWGCPCAWGAVCAAGFVTGSVYALGKGSPTATPELASGPCHRVPLRAMQMKAAAFPFRRSARPPAFCTSCCAWLAVRKQLGVPLFTLFHRLCPFNSKC